MISFSKSQKARILLISLILLFLPSVSSPLFLKISSQTTIYDYYLETTTLPAVVFFVLPTSVLLMAFDFLGPLANPYYGFVALRHGKNESVFQPYLISEILLSLLFSACLFIGGLFAGVNLGLNTKLAVTHPYFQVGLISLWTRFWELALVCLALFAWSNLWLVISKKISKTLAASLLMVFLILLSFKSGLAIKFPLLLGNELYVIHRVSFYSPYLSLLWLLAELGLFQFYLKRWQYVA
ncbi:hypothetical protein [Lactobacillus nasalidis]|uniref:hypothetical protein n=1 Tax=Lactobacillus nasalidis TaxID=2797258 RepID=UPI0019152183|nr:hypothetical protein [Lactobacillus nasalidis]